MNVINGCFASGGDASSAQEVYASQISGTTIARTHSKTENEVVIYLHDDALVITTEINEFDVKRVLIDTDSSTDVFFLNALKYMEK